MALASLKTRIERLQAKHKVNAEKVVGVIGGIAANKIETKDGVFHLRFAESPTGEPFAEYALKQQSELQNLLRELGDTEAPQYDAPEIVGTDNLAPLPAGKKRSRYLEINGREVDRLNLKRN
jgi:hypothetical protein